MTKVEISKIHLKIESQKYGKIVPILPCPQDIFLLELLGISAMHRLSHNSSGTTNIPSSHRVSISPLAG